MSRAWLVALLVATVALALAGQQNVPARDAVATPPKPTAGTASIAGTVVNDESRPVPVRRAIVTVAGPGLVPSRSAITDDLGAFAIDRLPAGRFTLTVSRASFVTSVYGAKRPGRPGTPVVVVDGQRVTGLSVKLWRGAVVAGVVRGEDGQSADGVQVRVIAAHPPGDPGILTLSSSGAKTNDKGEFRIFGLEAGTYLVVASPPLLLGSAVSSTSEAEMDAALAQLRARGAASGAAGGAAPMASAANAAPAYLPLPAARPFLLAPIYYPGTPKASEATPITLVAGQVIEGIDLALQRVGTSTVTGVVTRPDGSQAGAALMQAAPTPPPGFVIDVLPLGFGAAADGTFRIAPLAPGDYTITAKAGVSGPPPVGRGSAAALWGQTSVSVAGDDLVGVGIRTEMGPTLSGHVTFVGETLKPPADLTQLRVSIVAPASLERRSGPTAGTLTTMDAARVAGDGTFEFKGIPPGSYSVQITGPGIGATGWLPRSFRVGDRELLDRAIEIAAGGPSMNGVLTMTDRHTELSGMIQSPDGLAAMDVFVVAFAADRQMWGPGARRVRAVRPGVDGHYAFSDLPPGEYFLAAVADIDAYQTQSTSVLESLVPAAVKVSIGEGEKKVQDLRIGR